jgi:uncharacterized protein (DUF302 family)
VIQMHSPFDMNSTVEKLLASVESANMRLVSHIDGQKNAEKIGKIVPADQILEVFRPDYAVRVWSACKAAGIEIPLRIHIYEDSSGQAHVSHIPASELFSKYQVSALNEIAEELDRIFNEILSCLEE